MKYVTAQLLHDALLQLDTYSADKDNRIKGLFSVFVLKRLGVTVGETSALSIEDFNNVCWALLRVIQEGDPASLDGEKIYNPFGNDPIVKANWPRSTLWTRITTNKSWKGIVITDAGGF
ncbi:MAG TPA: hypothetical protein VEL28_09700 [Candidatus Binatia bacterium]|nr:hypothetical protein [Candidatus Binatia bacterium]